MTYTTGCHANADPNIRFYENMFSSSVVVSCMQFLCSVVEFP
jgi:hypothetical protein